jgi:hypothetical protein
MKYAKLFTIIAIICMFAFVTVWAQDTKAAAPAAPAKAEKKAEMKAEKKAEPLIFKGKVTAVDAVKNTFTVEGEKVTKDGTKKIVTKTFEAGKDIKIADIVKDAKIKVTYKKGGDKLVAEIVKPVKEEKKIEKKAEVKKEEKKAEAPKAEPKK